MLALSLVTATASAPFPKHLHREVHMSARNVKNVCSISFQYKAVLCGAQVYRSNRAFDTHLSSSWLAPVPSSALAHTSPQNCGNVFIAKMRGESNGPSHTSTASKLVSSRCSCLRLVHHHIIPKLCTDDVRILPYSLKSPEIAVDAPWTAVWWRCDMRHASCSETATIPASIFNPWFNPL